MCCFSPPRRSPEKYLTNMLTPIKRAIIHTRKSSIRQSDESHETQMEACHFVANRYNAKVVKIWNETFSGRKNVRPVFDEVLEFIDKGKLKIDYYIIRAIDRFTRAGTAEYETMKKELSKRGVELIDSYGIIQPPKNTLEHLGFQYDWSMQSPSGIAEVVMAENSRTEITNMLTRMIGQEIRLTRDGYKVRQPSDGYVNKKIPVDGKKKVIQVPDPERAHFYIEMFNLRAAGIYSDKEIAEKLNALGFRTKKQNKWSNKKDKIIGTKGGVPLTVKHLQEIIKRPIYAGVSCEKWTNYQPIKAQYDGLVTVETFNKANRSKFFIKEDGNGSLQILYDYSPFETRQKRLRNNPLFPYKFILCPLCGKPFMGSSPKGKINCYPTYHCARGHKYYGISKGEFEGNIRKFIKGLQFRPKYLNYLETVLLDRYREREKEVASSSVYINKEVTELKSQKVMALDALITTKEPTIRAEIEQRIAVLQQQINTTERERNKMDITEKDIHDFIAYAKYLMEHTEELLIPLDNTANLEAQRALFGLVFDEIPNYHQILNGTPKLSFIFELSADFHEGKSYSVRPPRLERGTFTLRGCCSTN